MSYSTLLDEAVDLGVIVLVWATTVLGLLKEDVTPPPMIPPAKSDIKCTLSSSVNALAVWPAPTVPINPPKAANGFTADVAAPNNKVFVLFWFSKAPKAFSGVIFLVGSMFHMCWFRYRSFII